MGPPNVREARFNDYCKIAAVQAQNGLSSPSQEDWLTLWQDNPVYRVRNGDWPIGWVLEAENGEIVGTISSVPLAYSFRGRTLLAAAACSWAVDPPYRRYSMSIFKRLEQQADIDILLSSTVSSRPSRIIRWSKVPVGSWDRSAFWITDHRGFARHALLQNAGIFATTLSLPVSVTLLCWEALKPAIARTNGRATDISVVSAFDSRFDEFWEELKQQNSDVLLAVRSRVALEWHFRRSLNSGRVWVLTATRDSRLVAYAIFDRLDNTVLGLKRVRFVDFQWLRGAESTLHGLLYWMLQRCREEGFHCVEITGGWLDRPGLPRLSAPYNRKLASWTFYYKTLNPEIAERLQDPNVWAPTSFDGDGSL
jgi:hypothetical protein